MKKLRKPRKTPTPETIFKSVEKSEAERGRPTDPASYTNFIGAKVTPALDSYLNKLAIKYGVSKGELIRTLLEEALIMEASQPLKTFYTLRRERIEDAPPHA